MLANEVRPGPNRYITGEGVLFDLPEYLNDLIRCCHYWRSII